MFIDPDPKTALHLAKAITNYKTLYRRNGANSLPKEIDQILEVMTARALEGGPQGVTKGQPRSALEGPTELPKTEVMGSVTATYAEAARYLGCSVKTVKRRVAAGVLPALRDQRIVRIRITDLDNYLAAPTEGAPTC
jgi:excisionase family DNA binding protein